MPESKFERHPFLLPTEEVAATLSTDVDKGLTSAQVQKLQEEYPPNELDAGGAIPWYTIFLKQLFNAMVLVLMFAMALSFGISDYIEGAVLAAVIVLNVSIGFVQEYRAEKKMDALRALSSPSATILRDGKTQVIPNAEVVPGDICILKTGDTVPADLRLFEVMNLSCDEQSLTGESMPVDKIVENSITVPGSDKLAERDEEVGIGDRVNIAYATTVVRKGRGRGIVVETGMQTEVGKIAASTRKKPKAGRSMNWRKYGKRQPIVGLFKRVYDFLGKFLGLTEGTPLQRKLASLAYVLFGCALILAVIVFGVNRFQISHEIVIYAISTGIAIIPESLVAVLTITMVQATRVMRKANVVVRDLSALEALGGVTNICSDKTGTLTQGAMIVKKVWLPATRIYTVRDSMDPSDPTVGKVTYVEKKPGQEEPKRDYDAERSAGALKFDVPEEKLNQAENKPKKVDEAPAELTDTLRMFLLAGALCNLATVRYDDEKQKWQTTGEPTEIALQVFAHRFERGKKVLEGKGWKQVSEFPFDSTIKRMSVVYDAPGDNDFGLPTDDSFIFTKGAVERVIDLCSHLGQGDDLQEMNDAAKETILEQMNDFASQGQRVLAVAYRKWDGKFKHQQNVPGKAGIEDPEKSDDNVRSQIESNLTLLGLVGIYDPPRKETTPAIRECSSAGIKVHMLTGDHPATAAAIAKEVGILPFNMGVLPAEIAKSAVQKATDFDKMTDAEIDALPELPLVIARCAPDTKTRMIEALRRRSAFMAMTGDGVNDAPSLSNADVGIAMGSGSDVAKSASKIVLTDDKFNSIVAAIREGRRMFENIQKFVLHLLTSNVGEVILLIAGLGFQDESGTSVFPISPLQILWINMLTSSFPAFGLGREKANAEIMRKPPHSTKRGVFTNQILVDMLVYGFIMGVCTLMTFVIIVYGVGGGQLGQDCNTAYSESCNVVFQARAAVFAELTWLILISAWEFKSLRRSMFRLNPDSTSKFPFFEDIYENRFLFWSVIIAFFSVFLAVYIPGLNTNVFKHRGITWEWGLVFGGLIVFVVGVEAWKFIKRKFNLLNEHAVVRGPFSQGSEDPEGRSFVKTMSFSSFKSSLRSRSRTRTMEKQRD
ncbi:hypothetical protein PspLS_02256 [Pyricularia sp. CBS 133598]|nr:hypothetical protein PspLS_02256 [Pyricularia sp. CBS 133598]